MTARTESLPLEHDRVRVLFVMLQMAMGGSERLVYNLARTLDRRRFEPSIAWLTDQPALPEFEALGVPLYSVPKRRRFDPAAMRQMAAVIRTHRIDVVNAHHFMPFVYAWYGAKLANDARLVYTEHSQADVYQVGPKWQRIGGQLLRLSDAAIGISGAVSEAISSHFRIDTRHVHTIENGVDLDLFDGGPERRARIRQDLGFDSTAVVFGHVANFRRNKNHLFLLRAFRELNASRPDLKLVLVGQGADGDGENSEADVARFIREHRLDGAVRMLGYRGDVQDVVSALDVFCLVSYKEGLPLSLIEAMAAGVAVVGTDIDGIRGVVQPELNGLLVAPDDVPGLAGVLTRLASDSALRRRLGEEARRTARDKYSLTRCVRETQDLFQSLATRSVARLEAPASHTV